MKITLPPEMAKFVERKVRAGAYADPQDLVRDAIQVLMDQEALTPAQEKYLREEIGQGIAQADRGEYAQFTAESIIAEERRRHGNRDREGEGRSEYNQWPRKVPHV